MGHTPRPIPTVTREQAIAAWCRREAEREIDALFAGHSYTYRSPKEEWYHPGIGFMVPPTGGSSIQFAANPERLTYCNFEARLLANMGLPPVTIE